MSDPFAKLYETDRGQVLAMLTEGEEGPELRFFARPEGLGVCSVAACFGDDSEESWDKADRAFAKVDEEWAIKAVTPIYDLASKETK